MTTRQKEAKNSVYLRTDYNEITFREEARRLLRKGVNALSDAVTLTMGPNGSTVIIPDNQGKPYITKDGVSVANSIGFKDPIQDTAADLLKEVADKTVTANGDGTTTSICLANAFINKAFDARNDNVSVSSIQKDLDTVEYWTNKLLDEEYKRAITKEDIINVATVAANNDKKIGSLIEEAYFFSDNVQVKDSNDPDCSLDFINGMTFDTGWFSPIFINNGPKQSIEYGESTLVIVEGHLDNLKGLKNVLANLEATDPVIILADHFSDSVVKILRNAYNEGSVTLGLIKAPGFAEHRKALVEDIKLASNAKKTSVDNVYLGGISSIKATKFSTTMAYERTLEIERLATDIKEAIKESKDPQDIRLLQERLDIVDGSMVYILAGGKTEVEMKEKFDRIEDAVLATKCAIEGGVIPGGGVPLFEISKMSINPFFDCLAAPIVTMGLDAKKVGEDILDPVRVTRSAVTNAISVAKVLLSTDAVVLNKYQWN